MLQNQKVLFTIALVLLGAFICAAGLTSVLFENPTALSWILFVIGASMVVAGTVIGFTQLLDRTIKPVVEELSHGFRDDLEALQEGRITWAVWQSILTCAAGIVFIALVLRYHKFEAVWFGWLPVWIPSFLVAGLMAFAVTRTRWFNDSHFETPAWVFAVAICGFAIAVFLGIVRTENTRLLDVSYRADNSQYNYYQFNNYYFDSGSQVGSVDFDMPECSGDSCEGWAYLICGIMFVVAVLILVIGSAFIQSFWLFSGTLLVSMIILITMNALMYVPPQKYKYRY